MTIVPRLWFRLSATILALIALCACGSPTVGVDALLPPPPPHLHGEVLWGIVHDQCVPDEASHGRPEPCAQVDIAAGEARGVALLKDRNGVAQYLLMPTLKITGIEDPKLLAPDAVNYFQIAWADRDFVARKLGRALPRESVGIAVNSIYGRSQDLLHLHLDCVASGTVAALAGIENHLGPHWSKEPLELEGHPYLALRLNGAQLSVDPVHLLSQGVPGAASNMGAWTLVVVGARFADGKPGFVALASRADPLAARFASGEELLDHNCAVARS